MVLFTRKSYGKCVRIVMVLFILVIDAVFLIDDIHESFLSKKCSFFYTQKPVDIELVAILVNDKSFLFNSTKTKSDWIIAREEKIKSMELWTDKLILAIMDRNRGQSIWGKKRKILTKINEI